MSAQRGAVRWERRCALYPAWTDTDPRNVDEYRAEGWEVRALGVLATPPAAATSDERCARCGVRPSEPCPVYPHGCGNLAAATSTPCASGEGAESDRCEMCSGRGSIGIPGAPCPGCRFFELGERHQAALAATQAPAAPATGHPVQPLTADMLGVTRFKANAAVKKLLSVSQGRDGYGLNELARDPDIPREDHVQLAQLIGYSLSGFGELSYVSDEDYRRASASVVASPVVDNSRCKFASGGGARCVSHCGDPVCLGSES